MKNSDLSFPKVIAHRGASAAAPENTLAAFVMAQQQGADGIELDVMLSKDGQLVVIHDDSVNRTTNGTGKVAEMTLADLKQLDAGSAKDIKFAGERIPTLAEVFETFAGKFFINIELKNYASMLDALPFKVMDLIRQYDVAGSVMISSFNPVNLTRFYRRMPEVPRGLLTMPGKSGALLRGWLGRGFHYNALHPYFQDVDDQLMAMCKKHHHEVNVWTVDDAQEILRLSALGVHSLITNDPQRTRQILEKAV